MQTNRYLVYFGFLLVVIVACCQAQSLLKTFKGTTRPPSIDDALKLKSANNTLTNSNKNSNKGNQKSSGKLAKNSNNVNNVNNDNDDDDDDNDDNNNGENEAVANKKKPNSKQTTKPSSKGNKNQKQKESKQAAKKLPADDDDNEDDDNGKDKDDDDDDNDDSSTTTEATTTTSSNDDDNDNDNNNENENCTAPSINDFPSDLFTQTQRRFGAVLFHVAFAAYLFLAIMVVCDDYFMTSLEIIGQNLNLDQDVAGATFMAAGSSAPEVFISLVGIIVGESNPGIGAIVGSAIFNILFVVGLCGLFVLGTAKLTMWPFFRDAVFYCAAILLLVLLIRDDKVYWYESFVLLAFYGVYIFFMMNNDRFKNMAYEKFKILQQEAQSILPGGLSTTGAAAPHNKQFGFLTARRSISKSQSGYNRFNDDDEMYAWGGTLDNIAGHANIDNFSYQNSAGGGGVPQQQTGTNKQGIDMNMLLNADSLVASNTRQIDFDTAALQIMLSSRYYFRPKTRFRMAVRRVIDEILWIKRTSTKKTQVNMNNFDLNPLNKQNYALFLTDVPNINEPGGRVNFAKWAVMVPARILFYFTMPDCRVEKYKKWYILTFCVSILWLAVLSYLIIWMITVIGYTLGIPDSLMAVTLIAAGTSIPDAYTSVVVVKEGMVDMGVSNIIGSNVFDLLIGLALPWFIKSIFNNGYVIINSNGLVYDSLLLYACVFATICVIHVRKWNLDRRTGYLFLSIYSAFIIFSSAIELNVFSYVNPPMCS